jgi:FG-GAP repeat
MSLCLSRPVGRVVVVLAFLAFSTLAATAQPPVTVTAADPAIGETETVGLVVKVKGKNFGAGARADFFKSGTSDPAGISVRSTRFVSSTEVEATLDIAAGAALSLFDIRVTNTNGRSGKGSDLFQVVQKGQASCDVLPALPAAYTLLTPTLTALNVGRNGTFGEQLATYGLSDGRLLLVVGSATTIETFFLGDVGGTLQVTRGGTLSTGFTSTSLAVGDLDVDGLPDIVVGAQMAGTVRVFTGSLNGSGELTFSGSGTSLVAPGDTNNFGTWVAVGDIDACPGPPCAPEILVGQLGSKFGKTTFMPGLHVYRWPSLTAAATLRPPGTLWSDYLGNTVEIGDVTGDGQADIVVGASLRASNGLDGAGTIWVYPGPYSPSATPLELRPAPGDAETNAHLGRRFGLGDLLGTGGLEIAATTNWGVDAEIRGEVFSATTTSPIYPLAGYTFRPPSQPGLGQGWGRKSVLVTDIDPVAGDAEIVVGAPHALLAEGCNTPNVGAVHVYRQTGNPFNPWTIDTLRPPTIGGVFGWSVAAGRTGSLSLVIVSDRLRTTNGLTNAGQVFLYRVQ